MDQWVHEGGLHQPSTGAPVPTPLYTRPDLPFGPYQATSYKKPPPPSPQSSPPSPQSSPPSPPSPSAVHSVIDASRILYQLNPDLIMENNISLFRQDGRMATTAPFHRRRAAEVFLRIGIAASKKQIQLIRCLKFLKTIPRLCSLRQSKHKIQQLLTCFTSE
jgi:hypothetical protein